jgi:hypothetical protein
MFESVKIILGMLTELVVFGVAVFSLSPAGIHENMRGNFLTR